ncbi:MAG TPA: DUF1800 domain-containing protein, partial [Saprospiraceae bacterium]|nr:DUF1800 domain-containing protein [Saprospiraceae bacterium]
MPAHADRDERMPLRSAAPLPSPPPGGDPLAPYVPSADKPWDMRRVAHLYRRAGFGASLDDIRHGLSKTPSELVDELLDAAADLDAPAPPFWAGYTLNDYNGNQTLIEEHRWEIRRRWFADMIGEGLRAKMALFWHNHFVTELNVYQCNAYLWSYYSLLHEYAFGNFRIFAREMGKNPAMLTYLNGNLNVVGQPNENYARELMELFTMGESNGYTQADIVEMARALTGWQARNYLCTPAYYDPALHDNGDKTIFGKTSNYGFTTAHNLIFTERAEQVSTFIAGKLYKHFVYEFPDPQVVASLAQTFRDANWDILPVLRQLLKSEHFFDDTHMSARIRTPVESMLPIFKAAKATYPGDVENDWVGAFYYWVMQLGQDVLNPVNVAGWPGYHKWINESTLTARWVYSSVFALWTGLKEPTRENLRELAVGLTNESNKPEVIVPILVEFFTGQTLDPIHLQAAIINFKGNIPENYFLDGTWNLYYSEAPYQIINLLYYLVRLPEYQ